MNKAPPCVYLPLTFWPSWGVWLAQVLFHITLFSFVIAYFRLINCSDARILNIFFNHVKNNVSAYKARKKCRAGHQRHQLGPSIQQTLLKEIRFARISSTNVKKAMGFSCLQNNTITNDVDKIQMSLYSIIHPHSCAGEIKILPTYHGTSANMDPYTHAHAHRPQDATNSRWQMQAESLMSTDRRLNTQGELWDY